MSKGFHRAPSDMAWDNSVRPSFEGPGQAMLEASHFGTPLISGVSQQVPAADFDPGPPKMDRAQAKSAGFTGNSCNECGSMQMVRNGTCEKCNSCGATTGCS